MNKKINLAVAGAVLLAASAANAGIIIPAGEWTLDVNGNVNHFMIVENPDNQTAITGGIANAGTIDRTSQNTGLLPSWLGFTGTTRQNDLDVSFTISFQPGTSTNTALQGGNSYAGATGITSGSENRQAFMTFGDKSWGTVKIGKDLGIFGSDAILSDMTLLGVGGTGLGTANGTTTTLGHIGTGYMYADWKGQFSYTTPNMNGFQATVGIIQPWVTLNLGGDQQATAAITAGTANGVSAGTSDSQENYGYEGKASYTFSAGKVWVGFAQQDVDGLATGTGIYSTSATQTLGSKDDDAYVAEIGATVSFGNLGLTGYYYSGEGAGTTGFLMDGFDAAGTARDSDGFFAQATYVIPTGTKLGVSYGRSDLDSTSLDETNNIDLVSRNEMWTVGAYHPLTKHLNLVAEYNSTTSESMKSTAQDVESDSISLGAILFF